MVPTSQNDCAVVFCCDRNYFHLALFTIWQIAHHNPDRRFDFVIASRDEMEVPDWAKGYGILLHRTGDFPQNVEVARYRGSLSPLYRLMLAREVGDRYRRILYLDCDLFIEGGDFNRLLEVDLGPYPIAAALDAPFLYDHNYRAQEYARLNWPAMPYANTGVQVIDTRAYREQDLENRSFAVIREKPEAIIYTDQSLTNVALRGKFAQLSPSWNWQWSWRFPLFSHRFPVFVRHFIGPMKPDRDATSLMDMRYQLAYRDFFERRMPEMMTGIAPPKVQPPLPWKQLAKIAYRHMIARQLATEVLARFQDPYKSVV